MQQIVESGPTTERVRLSVHTSDPISRAGVLSQLRQYPEIEWVDTDTAEPGSGHVALLVVGSVDETTLLRLRTLVQGERARPVLVVERMREADLLNVAGCGVTSIVWRREATPARLLRAILAAHRGEGDLPADLLGTFLTRMGQLKSSAPGPAGLPTMGLAPREVEVLQLVAEGLDTAQIADKLAYSERTVKNVLQNLTSRLHLRNRTHAVAYAVRAGYI
ncbi:response regulator transcription factor [Streptomyces sp. A1499]|uniref:Response regulator transcription factor n=1 Tax=Streptomyces alfalfae TaxID=1642299 RepID=A0A7T4PNC5_9ACTN|nr:MULTISPECIES: response regulator transcription factor [Streptomyces]QQC93268.1 response regulator transcription factor [Streptomyces alfalfae]THC46922.1 response regulator transcription factor [Streptomyces sp. A1499]